MTVVMMMFVIVIMMAMRRRVCVFPMAVIVVRFIVVVISMPMFIMIMIFVPVLVTMDVELDAFDAALVFAAGVGVPVIQIKLFQLPLNGVEGHPEVDHCADEHVATDPAEDIQIESFHIFSAARALI
jgi:hypothetical protein